MDVSRSSFDRAGLALMFSTIVVWAGSWIAMKLIVPYIGPFDFVALRYVVGALVLFALAIATRRPLGMPPWKLTLLIGLTQTAGFQGFVQTALVSGGVGKVSLMAYTMPFWVVLFAWILLGDRPTLRHVWAFALAGMGLLAIIAPWQGLGSITGSLLALAGGACWGMGTVLAKMMFQRHTPNVLNLTAWQMLLGAVLTWPITLVFHQQDIVWAPVLYWGVAYMAIIASGLGWWLWLSVVRRVSATVAGMSSLGVPVLTVILAWLLLSERPTALELIGVAFIMAGLVAVNMPGRRRVPATARR